jgi:hypothetical protein
MIHKSGVDSNTEMWDTFSVTVLLMGQDCMQNMVVNTTYSRVVRVIKVFRILRIVRILKLVKFVA